MGILRSLLESVRILVPWIEFDIMYESIHGFDEICWIIREYFSFIEFVGILGYYTDLSFILIFSIFLYY